MRCQDRGGFHHEIVKTEFVAFTFLLRFVNQCARSSVEVSTVAEDFMVAAVVMVAEVTGKSVRLQT